MANEQIKSPARNLRNAPRKPLVWFLSAATSSIAVLLSRQLLFRGDKVVAAVPYSPYPDEKERLAEFQDSLEALKSQIDVRAHLKVLHYDIRYECGF